VALAQVNSGAELRGGFRQGKVEALFLRRGAKALMRGKVPNEIGQLV
jgi:hypothetical protein